VELKRAMNRLHDLDSRETACNSDSCIASHPDQCAADACMNRNETDLSDDAHKAQAGYPI